MRLINVKTYALEEFYDAQIPLYAILSHTWETEEVLFEDMENLDFAKKKRGFRKIELACEQAVKDRLDYVWVDTCCIDKSSSAELQEAINSMFRWYANSKCCYAYLPDILGSFPKVADNGFGVVMPPSSVPGQYILRHWDVDLHSSEDELQFLLDVFSQSRWFTRGWTLQELIAPEQLIFFGSDWNFVGDRQTLNKTISKATKVDSNILTHRRSVSSVSVAQKMAWAAGRKTSRVEDQAYCLLGLFGINMPMLYGEGPRAFERLQEEVMRQNNDQTILAWSGTGIIEGSRLLALSPADYIIDRKIVQFGRPESFEMTNRGLRIIVPILDRKRNREIERLAVLNCRFEDDLSTVLALRLKSYKGWDAYHVPGNVITNSSPNDLGRLTLVDSRDLLYAEPSRIEITRSLGLDQRGPRLWLDLYDEAVLIEVQIEGSRFPRTCRTISTPATVDAYADSSENSRKTNSSAIVDAYDDYGNSGGLGALFKCPSGEQLFIAFGFERNRPSYYEFERHIGQLGVWMTLAPPNVHISYLMREHFARDAMRGVSQSTKAPREVKLEVGNSRVMHADVSLRNVLGEETILCTVRPANMPVEIYSASDETVLQHPRLAVSSSYQSREDDLRE